MEERYFEQYELGAERRTMGRTITETDIVLHAGQTGDFYPHHMDAEWCKTQEFGQRVAHGTLIFSVAVGMTADPISGRATIAEKREHKRPDHGIVVERLEVVNQRGETVLVCDHLLLVRRGEASEPSP